VFGQSPWLAALFEISAADWPGQEEENESGKIISFAILFGPSEMGSMRGPYMELSIRST